MSDVPPDRDLRLAVIEGTEVHALVFPCRRADKSWVNSVTGRTVKIYPTHYQDWASHVEEVPRMESGNHDFDYIAKRLWFGDQDAARLVAKLAKKDRDAVEQCLLSFYGVFIDLSGRQAEITTALEKARRK